MASGEWRMKPSSLSLLLAIRYSLTPHFATRHSPFLLPLQLHELAREPLLQHERQFDAGELPGRARECELDAKLALARILDREPEAEFADAVARIAPELPDIAGRVPVEPLDTRGRVAQHRARPAVLDQL